MAFVINTNIESLTAQRNLTNNGIQLGRTMARLSSGMRINGASDDAAGLAISTRLGAQVRGVNQAIRNANDGMAMLQTVEGALGEITNIVTRIKELAVQSVNSTNSTSDRASLDGEVQTLISEVTRISTQTKFGSTALLDGSFTGSFQVGVEVGQTVSASVGSFRASSLSGQVANQALTFNAAVTAVGAADANTFLGANSSTAVQLTGPKGTGFIRQTTAGDDTGSAIEGAQSAIALAKAVNESTSLTGVSATATAATYSTGGAFVNNINIDGTTNVLVINGQNVVVNLNGGSAAADRQLLIGAINSQVSGVTAAAGAGTAVTLTAADGRNISVKASGTGANTVGGEVFGFTTAVATESTVARGGVTLQAGGNVTSVFTAPNSVTGEGTTNASASSLASLSVSSVATSNLALLVADSILDAISTARGSLGALQNRLQSTVANLSVVSEKVSDAKSRILDADFAAETAALTKGQILQQAGLAILAQANQSAGAVLALLKQ